MSAISNECAVREEVEVTVETTDMGLVEVGAVSETKGGVLGISPDSGNGFQRV